MKADTDVLKEFLAILPRGVPLAFEFRHASCLSERSVRPSQSLQSRAVRSRNRRRVTPDVLTADSATTANRKPAYTPEERQNMIARVREHVAAGRDVFAYFKHEETPQGALYAVEVLKEIQ